jgi:RNA polymerase sigma-70 factor (ECF subfamily)
MQAEELQALEEEIGACLDRGDLGAAATAAVRGYGPQILGYLVAVLRDDGAGFDVFSQFSEDLWRGIGGFRRDSSFRTWAYKLAWHAAKRYRRDAFRRRVRPLGTGEISKIAEEVRSSTVHYLRTAVKDGVSRLRESLDPQEQTLLILRVDRNLSWTEVAEILSEPGEALNEAILRKRFERVKAKLRKLAEREGLLPK